MLGFIFMKDGRFKDSQNCIHLSLAYQNVFRHKLMILNKGSYFGSQSCKFTLNCWVIFSFWFPGKHLPSVSPVLLFSTYLIPPESKFFLKGKKEVTKNHTLHHRKVTENTVSTNHWILNWVIIRNLGK